MAFVYHILCLEAVRMVKSLCLVPLVKSAENNLFYFMFWHVIYFVRIPYKKNIIIINILQLNDYNMLQNSEQVH